MARLLTGIQSSGATGEIHLGNILGAIMPGVELSRDENNEAYFFIADLHSLTTVKDAAIRKRNVHAVAAAWLAFGFDTDNNVFYRQSDIPEVCELTWYLSCFTPYPMLANAHSFKDKSEQLSDVNAGLFNYPVLMAADILLYDAEFVPVGKDQRQHLEMTRDIAGAFNHQVGETLVLPEAKIDERVMTIPGTDGRKMSKSYNNFINIFLPDKKLRKVIMSIETDSTPLEDPKDASSCNVFALYQLLASEAQIQEMKANYEGGNYGYGHAKQALFELIIEKFQKEREIYWKLIENPSIIEEKLALGAIKARKTANEVLQRVRVKLGYEK
ncbi:tryptophan--tRNA ligase [Acidiluteibacter ferrifornacis]|jgi:tryptophanyl-tRNA synthetase|uniref:Tryptophan--tRNA ligase n=1 Tax=Acidiluteibacter ferrifornacis TaxID=2692424 RepID=A0A6N9NFS0_9FLAO|nr:tryptophan--tRNA ligase [Acidiluteibacter ferrifornacis]NBG64632.1 tryptophan--tRNA ligase [Acidiluteibacter ferrifornacis]